MDGIKGAFLGIFALLAVIALLTAIAFMSGWIGNRYDETIGRDQINVQHENFKESNAYVDGIADDLAKYKLELVKEKDPIVRQAIIETIIDRTSNFDSDKLESDDLREFLEDIRRGDIQ